MYSFLSKISGVLSEPFFNMANGLESWPIVFTLILGLLGALAPCQLTGNISAVTLLFKSSNQYKHENPFGSFMLGFSFSLAFCPTMFILFFVTLMPIVLASP